MDDACWSRTFAEKIARLLGYRYSEDPGDGAMIDLDSEARSLVEELTEGFRYLPPEKIQLALDFAQFLHVSAIQGPPPNAAWVKEKLREIRDLVQFLRSRYGYDQPADEKDY